MKVVWTSQAAQDLTSAVEYLSERDLAAANRLADDVLRRADDLASGFIEGPVVKLEGAEVRGWSVPPYHLYYKRSAGELWVLRLYHQRRAPIDR